LFARGGFPTSDGRARMVAVEPMPDAREAGYPLVLNTGRVRDQWHTMTRTGRVPQLMTHTPGPRLVLHPRDAARRGIADGDLVRVCSLHGSAVLRAGIDDALRAGDVFMPMHWTDQFSSSGPVDRLVHGSVDPVSGQPDLKGTKVEVTAVAEAWRGLLLRSRDADLTVTETVYWSKAPLAHGFIYEMSGQAPLTQFVGSERALRDLLQVSGGAELASYSDPKRSVFRYAALVNGKLEACVFFAGPGAAFAEADRAMRLLGQVLEPAARLSLLAGMEAGPASGGKVVCSCFAVGDATIRDTIRTKKLTTQAEIGATLGAGTNCGSCIPELQKLLLEEAARLPAVA
jgi:assimilatory nitrate reductase catalytic subunit